MSQLKKKTLQQALHNTVFAGMSQICTRGLNCTRELNCTKVLLHEDTFARADNFARRYFAWAEFFFSIIMFISYIFIFTITVAPNPYPRSVTFFSVCFLLIYLLVFFLYFFVYIVFVFFYSRAKS